MGCVSPHKERTPLPPHTMKDTRLLQQLSNRRIFIVCRVEPKPDGGTNKFPINPMGGYKIDGQDSVNWMLPAEALEWANYLGGPANGHLGHGVGIVIHEGSGLFFIDLDHARDPAGGWFPHVVAFESTFAGCYTETSVSGTGRHIIGSTAASVDHGTRNAGYHMECYTSGRFCALTGADAAGSVLTDYTERFTKWAAVYFPPKEKGSASWTDGPNPKWSGPTDDDELLRRARKQMSGKAFVGAKASFALIFDGQAGEFYAHDDSAVDQALANHLAFWTGSDCERMLRLMHRSELVRDKWEREDYIRGTILNACATQKDFYSGTAERNALPPEAPDPPSSLTVTLSVGEKPLPPLNPSGAAPPSTERGATVGITGQLELFKGCTYVEDVFRMMTPDSEMLKKEQFDVRFGGRVYFYTDGGEKPTDSAWDAFTKSQVFEFPQVRGCFFDPRRPSLEVVVREGQRWINSWNPVEIRMVPGDIAPFLEHLQKLFPVDWPLLLNYLKFMVQRKGEKCKWWPFLQGVPGNGKSFISDTMAYCIGRKFTQRPTPKNIDSNFNASLYGCLFIALEDVKVQDDYGQMWETLKPMVTQEELEVEKKGVDKVMREVCFNGIMNSNHKNGIRKERDDRRIGSFFAAQQSQRDLKRDGLDQAYFERLWSWAKADGWAHVAHYLATDPIDPGFRSDYAPATSSTEEHIRVSLGVIEQEMMNCVVASMEGFRGGWISSRAVDALLFTLNKRPSRSARRDLVIAMGYEPHPSLKDGLLTVPLADGSTPYLYVTVGHPWAVEHLSASQVREGFVSAQTGKT
jgi:hypothetical protein